MPILILVKWQLAARRQFDVRAFETIEAKDETGKQQLDVNSLIPVNLQLAADCQIDVRACKTI